MQSRTVALLILVLLSVLAGVVAAAQEDPLRWSVSYTSNSIVQVGISNSGHKIFALDSHGSALIIDSKGKLIDEKRFPYIAYTVSGAPVYSVAPGLPGYIIGETTEWGTVLYAYNGEGSRIYAAPLDGRIVAFSASRNGRYVAVALLPQSIKQSGPVTVILILLHDGQTLWSRTYTLSSIALLSSMKTSVSSNGYVAAYIPGLGVEVYSPAGARVFSSRILAPARILKISDKGSTVAYCSSSAGFAKCTFTVYQLGSGRIASIPAYVSPLTGTPIVAVDPGIDTVAVWDGKGNLTLYRIGQSNVTVVVPGVSSLAFDGDGKYLALAYREKVYVFSVRGQESLEKTLLAPATSIALSYDGEYLVAGDSWGRIYLLENPLALRALGMQRVLAASLVLALGVLVIIAVLKKQAGPSGQGEYEEEIYPE